MVPEHVLRTAEIIAVGSELLGSTRIDTNSLYIAERLARLGIELRAKAVVGDDREDLAAIFRQALTRADLVILTGGLGPTDDDITREVVAGVLGLPLDIDERIVEKIAARFAGRKMTMPEINRRQAQVPRGASVLENANGTAPGLLIAHPVEGSPRNVSTLIALLPGPPREMQPMIERLCAGVFAERASGERLYRATLFVAGRSESYVEQLAQPLYAEWRRRTPSISTTILAAPGQIEFHLTARDSDEERGSAAVNTARDELHRVLGDDVFSADGRSMEEVVGGLLRERGYRIAAAESCTGGLLTSRLTDVPGSSAYVYGALVAYSNDVKMHDLGVPSDVLEQHGAVSEETAIGMIGGVGRATRADVAVAITGIAGPDGGTPAKPVGTVVIAVDVPGQPMFVKTYSFIGNRAMVKFQSSQTALDRVRRMLEGAGRRAESGGERT